MSKNIIRIEQNGHVYRVVPVEGSDKWYTVTKDNRTVKQVRRVINHIRVHGIIPCVDSSPKGFFVASNEIEMSECIGTLESLADAIQ